MNADLPRLAHKLVHDGAVDHLEPSRAIGLSDDYLGNVVRRRIGEDLLGNIAARDRNRRSAEPLGEAQEVGDAVALNIAEMLRPGRLDIDRGPWGSQVICRSPRRSDQSRSARSFADADEDSLSRRPRAGNRMRPHMRQQLLVDSLGGAAQRQLAQCGEVARREIVAYRPFCLLRHIDLTLAQALDQVLGGEIDDLDIVRLVEDAVGHRLAHADPGDLGDDIVEALDMLDIECPENIDAGGNYLLDIKIALGMPAAGGVGVGEFVDQNQLRAPLEDRIEIHLGKDVTLVFDLLPRDDLEAFKQCLGLAPAVRLDDADDNIDAFSPLGLSRQQHLIGLADARRGAEKNL